MTENQEFANLADKNLEFFMNMEPKIRGLFPAYFDPRKATPKDYVASFGSLSDSFYEYLLKAFMLTDDSRFKDLYIAAVDAMHDKLVSKPHNKNDPLLVLGVYDTSTETLVPKMDHLSCFAPGMLALGARKLGRAKDMAVARGLMETCYQNYASSSTGLGAEEIAFLATPFQHGKEFERPKPQDFYVLSAGYELRAETVESLFVLYRTTGNPKYQDYAWNIALAIEKECKTSYGYSTLMSASDSLGGMTDYMPSPPDIASLDKVLFTTQGHLIPYPLGQR
ncbi:Endoplasmic reticulum mannosyl-oligosaccharide 1,2-alpha-mannosidase [Actinomortierella wolfii]|nr:Endoplasmic reticulum mannosyl-oligosaccharide 1,2-alpha-mannosidase [Actinomortierella wolfii]